LDCIFVADSMPVFNHFDVIAPKLPNSAK